jgi:hypothetical protein
MARPPIIHLIIWVPRIVLLAIGVWIPPMANTAFGTTSGWLSAGLLSTGVVSAGLFSAGHCQLIIGWGVHQARRCLHSPGSDPLCCGSPRDFVPALESVGQDLAICRGGKPMASRAEVLGDQAIGGQEALGMPC